MCVSSKGKAQQSVIYLIRPTPSRVKKYDLDQRKERSPGSFNPDEEQPARDLRRPLPIIRMYRGIHAGLKAASVFEYAAVVVCYIAAG
jgi:hypothetical protein